MPVWVWIVIAAIVVVVAGVLIATLAGGRQKQRTERLKQQFGPEYERTVSATGEQEAAEKELIERERRRKKLNIVALQPAALQAYAGRWHSVQVAFVDDPSSALRDADQLVTEVLRERGYPVDDFDQQADDISVDHPTVVANYRAANDVRLSSPYGDGETELQRQAFVHYRALFDELLEPPTSTTTSHNTTAHKTETTQETRA